MFVTGPDVVKTVTNEEDALALAEKCIDALNAGDGGDDDDDDDDEMTYMVGLYQISVV